MESQPFEVSFLPKDFDTSRVLSEQWQQEPVAAPEPQAKVLDTSTDYLPSVEVGAGDDDAEKVEQAVELEVPASIAPVESDDSDEIVSEEIPQLENVDETPAIEIVSDQVTASENMDDKPAQEEAFTASYVNPYTRSLEERVNELQQDVTEEFNSTGEATLALNSLTSQIAPYETSELVDSTGRLQASAVMDTEIGTREETVYSDADITTSQFLFFSNTKIEDHPEEMIEIASDIKRNQDAHRVLQLAEKVQDPTFRQALRLTAYEEYMQRSADELGRSTGPFFDIAYNAVFNESGVRRTPQQRLEAQAARDAELAQERPGLTAAEQQELADLLPHLVTAHEFWENIRRTEHTW